MIGYASIRALVVAVATFILYLRMPGNFTNPQFWAEDGLVFFKQALDGGWDSLFIPAAGYFTTLQRLIAFICTYFPAWIVPAIYNYFAFAFTLFAVWLATSPRLELPFRPLIALAIVVVPAGFEVLGSMGNTQWLVPVIALLILLLYPSKSRTVLAGEAALFVLLSLTGPFVVFLVPLGVVLAWSEKGEVRRRLVVLTLAMLPGLLIGVGHMALHSAESTIPYGLPNEPSPLRAWLALPAKKFLDMAHLKVTGVGAMLGSLAIVAVVAFTCFEPYRKQKLAMLFLGAAVMLSGMLKYRGFLPSLLDPSTTRYFYAANVFLIWMLCCVPYRRASLGAVAAIEIYCAYLSFDTPRIREDFKWQEWASQIPSDKTLRIPIAPHGWFIVFER